MDPVDASPAAPPAVSSADLRRDLARAWQVWRLHPGLPVAAAAVAGVGAASVSQGPLGLVAGLVALALLGWVGTERLWYLRAWRDGGLAARELLPITMRFFPRFVCLGLLFGAAYLVLCLPPLVSVVSRSLEAAAADGTISSGEAADLYPLWAVVWMAVAVLVLDMLGTFVTPALVYSTWRATKAVRLGVGLLRSTWPHAALYVVLPPLALVVVNQAVQPSRTLGFVAVVLASLLNLLVKGAVAAYYLRVVPDVSPDGAMKPSRPTTFAQNWPDHR